MRRAVSIAIVCLTLACSTGQTQNLRLPRRYISTSFTVHTMTGLRSDEHSRATTKPSPIEISKVTDDHGAFLQFVCLPRTVKDVSDVETVLIPFSDLPQLTVALASAEDAARDAMKKRANSSKSLFRSTGQDPVELLLVTTNRGRNWILEWGLSNSTYLINRSNLGAVRKALAKF